MKHIAILSLLCIPLWLWPAVSRADDPAKVYDEVCMDCHHAPKKKKQLDDAHHNQAEWLELIQRMIKDNNAEIHDDEIPGLIDYLVKTHGPLEGTPAQAPK